MESQTNVGDKKQIRSAAQRQQFVRESELKDLRAVMSTPEGRRTMMRFLGKCRTFESVWSASAQIHRDAGIQEMGHYILGELVAADHEVAAKMLIDSYKTGIEESRGVSKDVR